MRGAPFVEASDCCFGGTASLGKRQTNERVPADVMGPHLSV